MPVQCRSARVPACLRVHASACVDPFVRLCTTNDGTESGISDTDTVVPFVANLIYIHINRGLDLYIYGSRDCGWKELR